MISVFDMFSIGIGPSSSHTVGPMRAACAFIQTLKANALLSRTGRVVVECYGSLGQTGKGHGTGKAIILGLAGFEPESVDIEAIPAFLAQVEQTQTLCLGGEQPSEFPRIGAILFNRRKTLPAHSNGMTLRAYEGDTLVFEQTYYSIGGGFIIEESHFANAREEAARFDAAHPIPYPFESGAELLAQCQESGLSISGLMLANEKVFRSEAEIKAGLRKIWQAMQGCVERGCKSEGAARRSQGQAPGSRPLSPALWRDQFQQGSADGDGVGGSLCAGRQRGERRRRPGGDGADQRRRRHHPRGVALLRSLRAQGG
jgi:L-serine dehydratase